uniref:Uncharacterized protein n=1 Tax=Chlamydomonas euryale TaxID=1486919 RepID=A0A7R9V2A5_9CHLO
MAPVFPSSTIAPSRLVSWPRSAATRCAIASEPPSGDAETRVVLNSNTLLGADIVWRTAAPGRRATAASAPLRFAPTHGAIHVMSAVSAARCLLAPKKTATSRPQARAKQALLLRESLAVQRAAVHG